LRGAGRASLNTMVFAIHGFSLDEEPWSEPVKHMQASYRSLKSKFARGQAGQPVALLRNPGVERGVREAPSSILWIGRVVALECSISRDHDARENPRHRGDVKLKVSDVHLPAWIPSGDMPDRRPAYSDAEITMGRVPDLAVPVATAFSAEQLPGALEVQDGSKLGNYVYGWRSILQHAAVLDDGGKENGEAAELLLERVQGVMRDFRQPPPANE